MKVIIKRDLTFSNSKEPYHHTIKKGTFGDFDGVVDCDNGIKLKILDGEYKGINFICNKDEICGEWISELEFKYNNEILKCMWL